VFPRAAVQREDGGAGVGTELGVLEGLGVVVEATNLTRHGDRQVLVKLVDERVHERKVVHEERAVVAFLRDALWAPEVDVDAVTVPLYQARRRKQRLCTGKQVYAE